MTELKKDDIVELKIEKLVFEGQGLGRIKGFPVFVKDACSEDVLKVRIIVVNKNFAKAEIAEIIEPSPHRQQPFCALHKVCGGCHWQFINYEEQLRQKHLIVKETIKKIAHIEPKIKPTLPSDNLKCYRQKIQLPVAQTKNSKRFLIGFYKENSHEIVNIKHCHIQPDVTNEIIEFIRQKAQELGITAYDERKNTGEIRHIVFRFSTFEKNCTLTFVVNSNAPSTQIKKLALTVFDKFEAIKGIVFNLNTKKTNTILSEKFIPFLGDDFIIEKMGDLIFKISAGSFFQVNPQCAEKLLNTAKNMIKSSGNNLSILDAYCGVGAFGLWMSDIAKNVCGVEQSASSVKDAKENIKINNIENYELIEGDVKEIFSEFIKLGRKFDIIITDPPRKGCAQEALEQFLQLGAKKIIYISCNPSTLARDIKFLTEKNWAVEYVQPVDMFAHTYHVENVVLLTNNAD